MTFQFPGGAVPMLAVNATASVAVSPTGPWTIASTSWTEMVTFGGLSSPPTAIGGNALSVAFVTTVPGVYTFTATTTYRSGNATVNPCPPNTITGSFTAPTPVAANKWGGVLLPTTFGAARTLVDTVSTSNGTMMGGMSGAMSVQELIGVQTYWNGTTDPAFPGWGPLVPSLQFNLTAGKIQDQVMPADHDWAAAPLGVYATYTQELRIVWQMTVVTPSGLVNQAFSVPLSNLQWTIDKVAATDWELQ